MKVLSERGNQSSHCGRLGGVIAGTALIDFAGVKVVIDRILPLSEARRAHELSETGSVRGKLILRVKESQP